MQAAAGCLFLPSLWCVWGLPLIVLAQSCPYFCGILGKPVPGVQNAEVLCWVVNKKPALN